VGRQSDEEGEIERGKQALYIGKQKNGEMASLWEDQQRIRGRGTEWKGVEDRSRQIIAAHQQMRGKKKQISQTGKEKTSE
jgi:hypothetical protein